MVIFECFTKDLQEQIRFILDKYSFLILRCFIDIDKFKTCFANFTSLWLDSNPWLWDTEVSVLPLCYRRSLFFKNLWKVLPVDKNSCKKLFFSCKKVFAEKRCIKRDLKLQNDQFSSKTESFWCRDWITCDLLPSDINLSDLTPVT